MRSEMFEGGVVMVLGCRGGRCWAASRGVGKLMAHKRKVPAGEDSRD